MCRNVDFELSLPNRMICNTLCGFYEGVEFSVRFGTELTWFPIVLFIESRDLIAPFIYIGDVDNLFLRGYATDVREISDDGSRDPPYSVQICNFDEQTTSVELRWLQTGYVNDAPVVKDIWSIDEVEVTYENGARIELLHDSFDGTELK